MHKCTNHLVDFLKQMTFCKAACSQPSQQISIYLQGIPEQRFLAVLGWLHHVTSIYIYIGKFTYTCNYTYTYHILDISIFYRPKIFCWSLWFHQEKWPRPKGFAADGHWFFIQMVPEKEANLPEIQSPRRIISEYIEWDGPWWSHASVYSHWIG